MNKETLRMQMLSGIITEGEYKVKLNENQNIDNIIKNLSSAYDLSTFESFKDEVEFSDLMDEIIAQMNNGVKPDYSNMNQDEINNLVDPIKKQVDDYIFKRFNKKIFTEGEYKAKLKESKKESLNEHYVAGGIVGIGAINQIPSRAKADYEDAFEHFLSQKYSLNEMGDDMPEAPSHEETDAAQVYEGKLDGLYMELKDVLFPYYTDLTGKERVDMIEDIIKELNSYISILQDEKKAKQ